MDTHATQACRKYEKFVKDNPIVSSRRNTPVQVQGQRVTVNSQERPQQPLFPHPPVQRYNPTVLPQIAMHKLTLKDEERESREHSQKSPQNQMKEVQTLMLNQFPHQMSCQDIRMDPHYQKPPQYAEINYHRPPPQTPVEVNEIGPTCIHENRPFTVNDVGRPVFVNHYYAGEAFVPVTNKKLIKLDECDV